MKDDAYRLIISINDTDNYSISDALSGKTILCLKGNITASTLDIDVVLQHIRNLEEALMQYRTSTKMFSKLPVLSGNSRLTIREDAHFAWTLSYEGKSAVIKDNCVTRVVGFDVNYVLKTINKLYYTLTLHNKPLNPKRDIVRRIIDVGLVVWVHNGHSVVVYEKNISGNCMVDCLVDGVYFKTAIVSTSGELGVTTIFTTDLEELLSFPTDDSILTFFPADEKAFDD